MAFVRGTDIDPRCQRCFDVESFLEEYISYDRGYHFTRRAMAVERTRREAEESEILK